MIQFHQTRVVGALCHVVPFRFVHLDPTVQKRRSGRETSLWSATRAARH